MWLFIQSCIIYTLFAFLLYFTSKNVSYKQSVAMQNARHWYSLPSAYWCCIIIFAFFSGMRWDVGVDYLSYLHTYQEALNGMNWQRERGIEEAYVFITNTFAFLQIHPTLYFALFAVIQLFFFLLAFRTKKDVVPYMMIVLILGESYLSWMNGIRQMIAACIFVWASLFIENKRFIPYIFAIILAYFFHHSALILIPIFLLSYDKTIWKNKWICLAIVVICFVLGNMPSWIFLLDRISMLLSFIGYDYYAVQMDDLLNVENFVTYTFGPRKFAILVSNCFAIYFYPKIRKFYEQDVFLDICFKLFFIGVCAYLLFDNTIVVFRRPTQYFTIFSIPMLGYTLAYLKKSKQIVWFAIMLLLCSSFIYLQCYSEIGMPEQLRRSSLYQFYTVNNS